MKKDLQILYRELVKKGPKYIVDCDFESLQSEKEIKSMCQQLGYCHYTNKLQQTPIHLQILGLGPSLKAKLEKCNIKSWGITFDERDFLAFHEQEKQVEDFKNKIVYLTADSENLI